MKKSFLLLLALQAAFSLYAQTYDLNKPECWKSKKIKAIEVDGKPTLCLTGPIWADPTVGGVMEVNPSATYVFTAEIRSKDPKPGITELGFWLFDADKKRLDYREFGGLVSTDTVLTAPCNPEDKVIKVQKAKNWHKGGGCVAFGVQMGKLEEPFRNIVPGIRNIEQKDGCYEITLARPIGKAYLAGTWVRQHQMGSHFTVWRGRVTGDWKAITGKVSGISRNGVEKGKWWPTTKFIQIRMASNIGASADATTEIRNVRIEIQNAPSYF